MFELVFHAARALPYNLIMTEQKRPRKPCDIFTEDKAESVRLSLLAKAASKEVSIDLNFGEGLLDSESIGISSKEARRIAAWLVRAADFLDSIGR